jgi:hypothetical protein
MDDDLTPKPCDRSLYFQVITAIMIGVRIGHFYPETGTALKPLGDGFGKWTGDPDEKCMTAQLNNETVVDAEEPEKVLDVVQHHMPVHGKV